MILDQCSLNQGKREQRKMIITVSFLAILPILQLANNCRHFVELILWLISHISGICKDLFPELIQNFWISHISLHVIF